MAAILVLSSCFLLSLAAADDASSPYLSPANTLFMNYENMVATFKIFMYPPLQPFSNFTDDSAASEFYKSLVRSGFVTKDPKEAHLFFVPFSADTSLRSLGRFVRDLRTNHPYWDRTLGADHFYVSPAGIDYSSDRNVLELKKNAIQISLFPSGAGGRSLFIPHKDVSLPPFWIRRPPPRVDLEEDGDELFLGYFRRWAREKEEEELGLGLVKELKGFNEFLVEEELKGFNEFLEEKEKERPLYSSSVRRSKFCLFLYDSGDVSWIADAMSLGCVPVVIVDRPIQDLPLMDVLRWSDMSLLVAVTSAARLKEVLSGVSDEKYAEMRELCVAASEHLLWSDAEEEGQYPLDAFHLVLYQLWLRRHAVRYARRDDHFA